MSLNYDLSKIKDKDTVCWYIAKTDFKGDLMTAPHKAGDRVMSSITSSLIMASLMVGLQEITDKNAMEWHLRLETITKVTGDGLFLGDQKNPTLDQIKQHIGLRTNVFPNMTRKQWLSKYLVGQINTDMTKMEETAKLKIGDWVRHPAKGVGIINTRYLNGNAQVRFGPEGPSFIVTLSDCRPATQSEIGRLTGSSA